MLRLFGFVKWIEGLKRGEGEGCREKQMNILRFSLAAIHRGHRGC